MRHRETVTGAFDTVNHRPKYNRSTCASGWNQIDDTVTYTGEVTTKFIDDVQTPGFQSLLKCGRFLPLNPVTISTIKETRTPGAGDRFFSKTTSGTICYKGWDTGPSWGLTPWAITLPPFDEDLIDSVVTQAQANAKSAVFDALTFAAEIRQTARLLGSNWNLINNFAARAARFANKARRSKREIANAFAQKWLEYRYGWLPLVYSSRDAIEALAAKLEKGDIVRGYGSLTTSLDDSDVETTGVPSDSGGEKVTTFLLTGSRTYRGAAYAEVLSNRLKWGVDPFLTGWELIPYSFIVDWFVSVGTWIQAVSPFAGAGLLGSMASVKDDYTLRQDVSLTWGGASQTGSYAGRSTELQCQVYTRFPHSGGVLPSWNPRITPERVLDLVALVLLGKRNTMRLLN